MGDLIRLLELLRHFNFSWQVMAFLLAIILLLVVRERRG
jgi:uncharacterized membrane protein